MSEVLETVTVVRKDHPNGKVDINKCDMTKEDVLWSDKPVVKKQADVSPVKKGNKQGK